jgi:serine/threonine protein kinase
VSFRFHAEFAILMMIRQNNILIKNDGTPVISDMGFHSMCRGVGQRRIFRDWHYMTPQELLVDGDGPPSSAKDVWSLGATIYKVIKQFNCGRSPYLIHLAIQILTGKPPGKNFVRELFRIHRNTPRSLPRPIQIDDELWELIQALLADDEQDRPTMNGVVATLQSLG